MPKKGHKSQAGVGDLYESPKVKLNITVTENAKTALDKRAVELGISKSELIERFARGLIGLPHQEVAAKKSRKSRTSLKSG